MTDLTYIIKPGDYLSRIAQKYYSADLSDELADYNDIPDPDRINAGAMLRLPAVLAGRKRQGWEPAPAPQPPNPAPSPRPGPGAPPAAPRPPGNGAGPILSASPLPLLLIGVGVAWWLAKRNL